VGEGRDKWQWGREDEELALVLILSFMFAIVHRDGDVDNKKKRCGDISLVEDDEWKWRDRVMRERGGEGKRVCMTCMEGKYGHKEYMEEMMERGKSVCMQVSCGQESQR